MAFLDVHWKSNVIGKQVGMYVLLPDGGKPPFPVFYLLHGLSDDHTIWMRHTRIEMYARKYPIIIAMPDGYRGFYTNNDAGPRFADYLGEEIPAFVERNFPARATGPKARCIGGLSMGGYGALRVGLGYAGRYASITSHSGAVMRAANPPPVVDNEEILRIFGKRPRGTSHDLVHLAKGAAKAGKLPRLRLDCGTEDFLLGENRRFHAELEKLGVPHEYEEFPGAHTWDYWDRHVQTALDFHARALGVKPL